VNGLVALDGRGGDRREGLRHTTLLRLAYLRTHRGREGCIVRNILSGGLCARVYRSLAEGDRVEADLCPAALTPGRVIWTRRWQVGIAFDEPVDVEQVLITPWSCEHAGQPRLPRIDIAVPAQVRAGAALLGVRVLNISQGGVRISAPSLLAPGSEIIVKLPHLPSRPAAVRWASPGFAGLCFHERLPFETLASWIAEQETPVQPLFKRYTEQDEKRA
jgi:hypothetical protein